MSSTQIETHSSKETKDSDVPTSPVTPSVHSADALCDLKSQRGSERRRKMAHKSSHWKEKQKLRLPWSYLPSWQAQDPARNHSVTDIRRPSMTPAVRGRWQVNVEDDEVGPSVSTGDTDWVVDGDRRPFVALKNEVALADLLKPSRPRKSGSKSTCSHFF